jgi:Ca2+-binding RTX toxin-like protein
MPTQSNDVIRMNAGVMNLDAGGGDDVIYWTPTSGTYTYNGGDSNEHYDTNVYMEKTGGDRLIIEGKSAVKVTFLTTESGKVVGNPGVLNFTGIERLHLGDGNDVVDASNARVNAAHGGTPAHGLSIWAGGGNDSIIGSNQGDFIDGGAGNDTIRAGAGSDFIQSSTGNDLIYGGAGDDNIRWGQGNFDEVIGNDTIYGGDGNDLINVWVKDGWENSGGVAVNIQRVNSDGSMRLTAETDIGGAHSKLIAQGFEQGWHEGRDTVSGASAVVQGSAGIHWNTRWGDDRLTGTSGNDTLEGGAGRDTITGGRGDDLISANGDFYNMRAPGDGDVDTLVFQRGFGHDTVLAFDTNIDILKFDPGMSYSAREVGNGTLLTFNSGDTILLSYVFDFI